MRFLSLFSGIEAASEAWLPLGWECVGVSDIDPFATRLLSHRHSSVPNLGDVTKITEADIAALGSIDAVVFGSPCQDLSVAGKRKGLNGERSGLFFTAMRIVQWARIWGGCRFALWENVPGAFSSNKGADFAVVVGAMGGGDGAPVELPPKGWGVEGAYLGQEALVEWSTLDAQWFGVAQRRRRVFALADFGTWSDRPPILLEPKGMRGDSSPSRGAGEDVAGTLKACASSGGWSNSADHAAAGYMQPVAPTLDQRAGRSGANSFATSGGLIPVGLQRPVLTRSTGAVAHCLNAGGMGRIDYETETMVAYMPARTLCRDGGVDEHFAERSICDALHTSSGAGNKAPLIAFNSNAQPDEMRFDPHVAASLTCSPTSAVAIRTAQTSANGIGVAIEVAHTLDRAQGQAVPGAWGVRRLTPVECERLQGFPDGHTAIPKAKDGPRYKALGNSMAVPVMRWIGQQMDFAFEVF